MSRPFLLLLLFLSERSHSKKLLNVAILIEEPDDYVSTVVSYVAKSYVQTPTHSAVLVPHLINLRDKDSFELEKEICRISGRGLHAIFGPLNGISNGIIQSIAENLNIVQFQTFWNPNSFKSPVVFNLYPENRLLSKALAVLVKDMDWRTYTILYENDDSLIRLQDVLKIAKNSDFPIRIRKLLPGDDQRMLLKEIKSKSEMHIIIDCSLERIPKILEQATAYNLTKEYNNYILTSLDAHTLDYTQIIQTGANITTLRLIDPSNNVIRYFTSDFKLLRRQNEISSRAEGNKLGLNVGLLYDGLITFITGFEKLSATEESRVFETKQIANCETFNSSQNDENQLATFIKNNPLDSGILRGRPLTGTIQFDHFGRRNDFKMQIVQLTEDRNTKKAGFRVTAEWDSKRPENLKYAFSEEQRQQAIERQIHRKVFRVVARLAAPYLMTVQPKKGQILEGNARFEGFTMDIIDGIAKILNFTYSFELVRDNKHGSYDPVKKEWNGLIRDILDRKADLAICDLTITYERGRAVDFSMPFMTLGISILYSKATKKPPDLFAFMDPLSLDIWLYMATAFVIMSILIYVAARLAPNDWENPHPCDPNPKELENIWSLKNCFWLTMGSIMTQGCDILPKSISTRMIVSTWWFFSLIITSSYTANLAAFLTNERMGPTIESAEDLAKQNEIKYGCLQGGATSAFFRDSNFTTYQKMWRAMRSAEPSVFELNNKDGVKRVLTSKRKYAFLMESSSIEYETERNCDLTQVGGWLDIKNYGIAMPINSPYSAAISQAVLKMQEGGELHRLKEKWWKEMHGGGKCGQEQESDDDSAAELGIDHVGGVFVVLTGGIGIAVLIALLEFLWNVRKLSVEGQVPPGEALNHEIQFAMDVKNRKKELLRRNAD